MLMQRHGLTIAEPTAARLEPDRVFPITDAREMWEGMCHAWGAAEAISA